MYELKISHVSVSMVGGGFRKLRTEAFSPGLGCCSPNNRLYNNRIINLPIFIGHYLLYHKQRSPEGCRLYRLLCNWRLHSFYLTKLCILAQLTDRSSYFKFILI